MTAELDPAPWWSSDERGLEFRTALNWGSCEFRPRPEYSQDRSRYV